MGGDGPVVYYLLKYQQRLSYMDGRHPHSGEINSTDTAVLITGLNWDAEYELVAVAVRPGELGEGLPTAGTTVRTKCDGKCLCHTIDLENKRWNVLFCPSSIVSAGIHHD